MSDDASPLLLHALERLLRDRDGGRLRDLEEYQAAFPGLEGELAAQYARLVTGAGSATSGSEARYVGGYRLVEEVGRGGQGVVHRAFDERLARPVALKLLTGLGALSEGALERFLREARAAGGLNHPGLCPIHDSGLDDGVPYIAMGFVEGRSLADVVAARADGTPPDRAEIDDLLAVFEQLARALQAAHDGGVVHRDVKPANLMLVPGGHPVVLDFGIARQLEDDVGLTQTGHVLGTPAYMSPEQISEHPVALDHRTDIYSLGVSLFEALTSRRPFTAPTREGLYRQIVSDPPPDPREANPALPVDVRSILETALAKDPDERYATAADLAEDLGRARRGEPILARPPGLLRRVGKWSARNPGWVLTLLLLFASVAVGTAVATSMARESERVRVDRQRLADAGLLRMLVDEADGVLLPPTPDKIPAYEAWFSKVDELRSREDDNRRALEAVRRRALPQSDADRAVDREHYAHEYAVLETFERDRPALVDRPEELAARDDYARRIRERTAFRWGFTFADAADRLEHEMLLELYRLQNNILAAPGEHAVTLEEMRARLASARELDARLREDHPDAAAWRRCREDVSDPTSVYGGLELAPTAGLVPLGRDRRSGLWEFWHVLSGERPAWDGEAGGVGEVRLDDSGAEGLVLVLLPGGRSDMGAQPPTSPLRRWLGGEDPPDADPDAVVHEGPVHEVVLEPFLLSKFEVTRAQWRRLLHDDPGKGVSALPGGPSPGPRHPVMRVDWESARDACRRWGLSLPTEAQWEAACRAGTRTPWHTGATDDTLAGHANTADDPAGDADGRAPPGDAFPHAAPVGSLAPNGWGLHDMHGNMAEWCLDAFLLYGDTTPRAGDGLRGSLGDVDTWTHRVLRPGSFARPARDARSSAREKMYPDHAVPDCGVRPAAPAPIRR